MNHGEFLERIRFEKRLTQDEMAKLLKLKNQQSYQYYVTKKVFSRSKKMQFEDILKVSFDEQNLNKVKQVENVITNEKLIKLLYAKVIKLEALILNKSVDQIKKEMEIDMQIFN